jgi:cephalosporin hydroxylase
MTAQKEHEAIAAFRAERLERLSGYPSGQIAKKAHAFLTQSADDEYSYNFDWLSRPIIQYPQDIVAMQELIWAIRPDLIIETGIAHGGSLIFSASMLAMLEYCDAIQSGTMLDPSKPQRRSHRRGHRYPAAQPRGYRSPPALQPHHNAGRLIGRP